MHLSCCKSFVVLSFFAQYVTQFFFILLNDKSGGNEIFRSVKIVTQNSEMVKNDVFLHTGSL